jgi:hypothetical protein
MENEKYVQLCVSLPMWILWRYAEAMHMCTRCCDQISKTDFIHIEVPRLDYEKLRNGCYGKQPIQFAAVDRRDKYEPGYGFLIIT